MPISTEDIQPTTPAATPAADSAPVESAAEAEIPETVLQIPEISALLQGTPPALLFSTEEFKLPEAQTLWSNRDALVKAGLGLYGLQDKSGGVIFNARFVSPEEVRVADQKGRITDLAAPFSELRGAINEGVKPTSEAPAAPAEAPAQPAVAPAPSGVQNRLATARTKNLAPGGPTSGPAPGQGRILNSILKPTV